MLKLLTTHSISFILVTTIVIGCSKNTNVSQENNKHSAKLLLVDVGSEAPTLDPAMTEDTSSTRISYDLFAGLVDFDQANQIIPGMAEKWEISPDGKTYTFHLRHGLKFSDGSPITAEDFVYSWRRLVDPKLASPYNSLIVNVVGADAISKSKADPATLGVSAPDAETFVVNLVNPDSAFMQIIHMPNVMVVPQKVIEKFGRKWTDPANIVTSGAYTVKEHVVNGYILADKNPNYYAADQVKIKQVKYLPYEDKNASIPAYKSGGLDVTFQYLPIDQFMQLKRDYPKQLHIINWEANYYYNLSATNPELAKNPKLRQALSMAVDRKALVDEVLRQGQIPMYSTVTDTIEHGRFAAVKYDWANWPRDKQIAEAKKLYAEAGYGPGHPYHVAISYNTSELHKKVALAVSAMWKSVLGVDTSIQNQEWKTFIQTRHKGDYQISRGGWVADYDSVTTYISLYECNSPHNDEHYCNPEFDKLVAQANLELDKTQQTVLYTKALQLALDDYAIIPLFQDTIQLLVKPYVQDYTPETNHLYHTQTKWMSLSE